MPSAEIVGLGVAVPPYLVTNHDLAQLVATNDTWISERTGIKERRVAGPGESSGTLGCRAARRALEAAGCTADQVDLLLVATVSPDHPLPSAASVLQRDLGAPGAPAMDIVAGCAGFVYALATAAQFIACGACETALVVGEETLSRIADFTDRSTCVLFGDGAGAAVVRAGAAGVRGFALGSDGGRAHLLMTPAGGSRWPATTRTVAERAHYVKMEGQEVFKGAVKAMVASSQLAIERSGLTFDDIDLVVPHQANQRIIDAAARRLDVPMARVVSNIARFGNTSAASIPLALHDAWEHGRLRPGQHVLLTAFGAGLSWASMVLDWTLPNPPAPAPEEPTRPGLPVLRALIDGSLWADEIIAPVGPGGPA